MRRHRLLIRYHLDSLRDMYGSDFGLVAADDRPRRPPVTSFREFDANHERTYTEIAALVAKHGSPGHRAWAVGSRVKGNWLPDSDWDVAVEGEVDRRACRAEAATRGIRLDIVASHYPPTRDCVLLPRRPEHA